MLTDVRLSAKPDSARRMVPSPPPAVLAARALPANSAPRTRPNPLPAQSDFREPARPCSAPRMRSNPPHAHLVATALPANSVPRTRPDLLLAQSVVTALPTNLARRMRSNPPPRIL